MRALVDSVGRRHTYLRISVTDRCNLRCIYCMPSQWVPERPREELLTFDEIERVSRLCAGLGVTKIRLTGGEPLVRKDLAGLVARLARIPGIQTLGMTTNGVLLNRHLVGLRESGLTHLNISLDTLRPDRFALIAGRPHLPDVLAGIDTALANGFSPLKVNVVVMDGINADELLDFVAFVRHRPVNLRFIEYMPFTFNRWNTASFLSCTEMKARIEEHYPLTPLHGRSGPSPVASRFHIDGWEGTVGFIASMSDHFCDTCNRLRLTADGSIKSCLFHAAEVNLRHALRTGMPDGSLERMIRSALRVKPPGHAPVEQLVDADNRTMIEIGG